MRFLCLAFKINKEYLNLLVNEIRIKANALAARSRFRPDT